MKAIRERVEQILAWSGEGGDIRHSDDWSEQRQRLLSLLEEDVPNMLDYINELENMPLVKLFLDRDREIERLCEVLDTIDRNVATKPTRNNMIPLSDFIRLQKIARQALKGGLKP